MNLHVEFDLKDTLTKEEVAKFEEFVSGHPYCNGFHLGGPHSGTASFADYPVDGDALQAHIKELFSRLQDVTHYECKWVTPAVMG